MSDTGLGCVGQMRKYWRGRRSGGSRPEGLRTPLIVRIRSDPPDSRPGLERVRGCLLLGRSAVTARLVSRFGNWGGPTFRTITPPGCPFPLRTRVLQSAERTAIPAPSMSTPINPVTHAYVNVQ